MTQLTDRDLFDLAAPLRQVEMVSRPAEGPHRPVRIPEFMRLAAIPVLVILVYGAIVLVSQQHPSKPAKSAIPATHSTRFVGLPPKGVRPSTPLYDGRVMLQISLALRPDWMFYRDGRIIRGGDLLVNPNGAHPFHTARVQQWLTPQGVQLLRSRILAIGRPVGLFNPGHNVGLVRQAYIKHDLSDWYQVRVGPRLVNVQVLPTGYTNDPVATRAQVRALARIDTLVANLAPVFLPAPGKTARSAPTSHRITAPPSTEPPPTQQSCPPQQGSCWPSKSHCSNTPTGHSPPTRHGHCS